MYINFNYHFVEELWCRMSSYASNVLDTSNCLKSYWIIRTLKDKIQFNSNDIFRAKNSLISNFQWDLQISTENWKTLFQVWSSLSVTCIAWLAWGSSVCVTLRILKRFRYNNWNASISVSPKYPCIVLEGYLYRKFKNNRKEDQIESLN